VWLSDGLVLSYGTSGHSLAGMVVVGWRLDLMILEVFSNLNDSMILQFYDPWEQSPSRTVDFSINLCAALLTYILQPDEQLLYPTVLTCLYYMICMAIPTWPITRLNFSQPELSTQHHSPSLKFSFY